MKKEILEIDVEKVDGDFFYFLYDSKGNKTELEILRPEGKEHPWRPEYAKEFCSKQTQLQKDIMRVIAYNKLAWDLSEKYTFNSTERIKVLISHYSKTFYELRDELYKKYKSETEFIYKFLD